MEYSEYDYIDGALINDHLGMDLDGLRKEFHNNCYGLATELTAGFMSQGVLASTITFKNGHSLDVKVNDYYDNDIKCYAFHSVILLGNCVLDILHSDKFISTSRYVKEMQKINPELRLDKFMTEPWYDENGYPMGLDIDKLKKL